MVKCHPHITFQTPLNRYRESESDDFDPYVSNEAIIMNLNQASC